MTYHSKRFYIVSHSIISCNLLRNPNGFTLIELIVVMTIIGTVFFFTIPRFRNTLFLNPENKVSRYVIETIKTLKENAFREQKRYTLHVGLDTNTLWVSDESMEAEAVEQAAQQAYQLPEEIRLVDVEFPDGEKIASDRADIFFYPRGYSDKVLIHLETDDNEEITYSMEPFLSDIIIYERHVGFND